MKVLVDTNVLVSAAWRDRKPEAVILWLIARPDWQWLVSAEIMEEYKEVLRRKKFSFPADTLQKWETLLDRDTCLVSVNNELDFPRDQKDAKFLACALSNNADFFITGDGDFEEAYKIVNTTIISVSIFHQTIIANE
ncbi:MAG TPA: putative toxin-antitoxin system toxin component, PIN family [Anaerolineales bacterium]|nr:putative toxin-antitoxin system toxin component, PIN family [Anaerolineales bacterium]HNB34770.1 putative toxin-antitoxin system toxin component, PIN family [Anaerolineales bacterium]